MLGRAKADVEAGASRAGHVETDVGAGTTGTNSNLSVVAPLPLSWPTALGRGPGPSQTELFVGGAGLWVGSSRVSRPDVALPLAIWEIHATMNEFRQTWAPATMETMLLLVPARDTLTERQREKHPLPWVGAAP